MLASTYANKNHQKASLALLNFLLPKQVIPKLWATKDNFVKYFHTWVSCQASHIHASLQFPRLESTLPVFKQLKTCSSKSQKKKIVWAKPQEHELDQTWCQYMTP